jgi:hypothetical protein
MPSAQLRILSGTVRVSGNLTTSGQAVGAFAISFYPFSLDVGSPGYELRDKKEIGAQGPFSRTPATIVAPCQFAIAENDEQAVAYVNLNEAVTRQTLAVDWALPRGSAQVFMQDIRFMVIREVSGGRPSPGGPPPVILERKRPRGRSAPRKTGKKGRR